MLVNAQDIENGHMKKPTLILAIQLKQKSGNL